ncbi:MAG: hypothetical protein A3A80_02125 [Candidatus Terrybacteria bacterium RIFCSPLOWO2_01_FULL_44_24]|uniref:VWFA domain-containing protein n=1 Tax=Candidatus Terrybacteria bacterium RIFCSPHIGHO2_01_FULL_43_35 TaxID=1802361 RepID=A0A1G2PFW0_9BACT|nr:MAG: hypothetical protein A2828_01915 [Candidatus Terrybacteria bacterium RIFCSPHIGHO2_01_FULL_43_35]OHA50877.1 MAG: hypothetical protein A3A80_02125 [Candidatus Terrybacteria bacterium RIFCSPLOWO2_01_FULL_44_24]
MIYDYDLLRVLSSLEVTLGVFFFVGAVLILLFLRKKNLSGMKYATLEELRPHAKRAERIRLMMVAAVFAVTALLSYAASGNPRYSASNSSNPQTSDRRDTMIVVDISGSMTTGDKYQLAQQAILRTLGANPNENIGLVFFATYAFSPISVPTDSHALFAPFLKYGFLTTPLMGPLTGGTDGANGVEYATRTLVHTNSKAKRIVFIGDMEDNSETRFLDSLQKAHDKGIAIELIAIKGGRWSSAKVLAFAVINNIKFISVNNQNDTEVIGPLPEQLYSYDELSLSSVMTQDKIYAALLALIVTIAVIAFNIYIRRPLIFRRSK